MYPGQQKGVAYHLKPEDKHIRQGRIERRGLFRGTIRLSEYDRLQLQKQCQEDEVVVASGDQWIIRKKSLTLLKSQRPSLPKTSSSTSKAATALPLTPRPNPPATPSKRFEKRDASNGMKLATASQLRKLDKFTTIRQKVHNPGSRGKPNYYNERIARPKKAFLCEGSKENAKNPMELLLEETLKAREEQENI